MYGIEVEYPTEKRKNMVHKGVGTNDSTGERVVNEVHRDIPTWNSHIDGTVGIEVASEPKDADAIARWHSQLIDVIQHDYGVPYEPCGTIETHYGSSTAGMHIHISDIERENAQWLARESEKDWLQTFVCSSPYVSDTHDVYTDIFRGTDYCYMGFDQSRYSAVNARGDRYEWRLPEPLMSSHVNMVMEFLDMVVDGETIEAKAYAKEQIENYPMEITAIRRLVRMMREFGLNDDTKSYENGHPDTWQWHKKVDKSYDDWEIEHLKIDGQRYYVVWCNDRHSSETAPTYEGRQIGTSVYHADNLGRAQSSIQDITSFLSDSRMAVSKAKEVIMNV